MPEPWSERSQIIAHLLNPAFLAVLLRRAVGGFESVESNGMPFVLSPLVLPFVLHPSTRTALPDIRTSVATWLQDHRELLPELPHRIKELVPYTKEALIFAIQRNAVVVDERGFLHEGTARMTGKTKFPSLSAEVGECWRRSEFVGRWLAQAGPVETVFGLMGIAP